MEQSLVYSFSLLSPFGSKIRKWKGMKLRKERGEKWWNDETFPGWNFNQFHLGLGLGLNIFQSLILNEDGKKNFLFLFSFYMNIYMHTHTHDMTTFQVNFRPYCRWSLVVFHLNSYLILHCQPCSFPYSWTYGDTNKLSWWFGKTNGGWIWCTKRFINSRVFQGN